MCGRRRLCSQIGIGEVHPPPGPYHVCPSQSINLERWGLVSCLYSITRAMLLKRVVNPGFSLICTQHHIPAMISYLCKATITEGQSGHLHYITQMWMPTHSFYLAVQTFHLQNNTSHYFSTSKSQNKFRLNSLFSTNTIKGGVVAHVQLLLHVPPHCGSAQSSFKKQLSSWKPSC